MHPTGRFRVPRYHGFENGAPSLADVLSKLQRSYCMSRIRGRDTSPEVQLRKALWRLGFRYRTKSSLPGKPDLVFPRYRTVLFIDGCFWHRCPQHFTRPRSNNAFWKRKIATNVKRDRRVNRELIRLGWCVLRVWEHEVRKSPELTAIRQGKRIAQPRRPR